MATMRTPDEWMANYTNHLIPSRVAEDFTTKKPSMVETETGIFEEFQRIEGAVKELLAGETGPTSIQNIYYQAFAKRVWKVLRKHVGGSIAVIEIGILKTQYTSKGLTGTVLQKIIDTFFSPVLPA